MLHQASSAGGDRQVHPHPVSGNVAQEVQLRLDRITAAFVGPDEPHDPPVTTEGERCDEVAARHYEPARAGIVVPRREHLLDCGASSSGLDGFADCAHGTELHHGGAREEETYSTSRYSDRTATESSSLRSRQEIRESTISSSRLNEWDPIPPASRSSAGLSGCK
jgi:hypothetical protein